MYRMCYTGVRTLKAPSNDWNVLGGMIALQVAMVKLKSDVSITAFLDVIIDCAWLHHRHSR